MKNGKLAIFIIITILQIIICKYLGFSILVTVNLLPAVMLFAKVELSPLVLMLLGFGAGMTVDLFGEGLIGLNAFSMVLLAALRQPLHNMVLGKTNISERGYIDYDAIPSLRLIFTIAITLIIYFIPYMILDGGFALDIITSIERLVIAVAINTPLVFYIGKVISDKNS